MSEQKYPEWIDEYAKSMHQAFVNMSPAVWESLDGPALFFSLEGTFISKLHEAVRKVKTQNYSMGEIVKSMPNVSSLRAALLFLAHEVRNPNLTNKKEAKEVIEFLVGVLKHMAKEDIFCLNRNIVHSKEEIRDILESTDWIDGNPEVFRELGKLYNSLASLSYALYRDFFPQEGNEIYGPYDASEKFGDDAILLIKHFRKINPIELWPEMKKLSCKDIKFFQVFKNVKFKCELTGMHSIYEGNLRDNLVSYFVMVDGEIIDGEEKIKELSEYFAEIAVEQMKVYENMSVEDMKKKFLEWECYQFVNFFKLAGMDWQPTQEMWNVVKDKEIPDKYVLEEFPSYEEYVDSKDWEVYWLKNLYAKS